MKWLVLIILFCVAVPAWAGPTYRGETTLWQDTVWSGEVLIDGIVTVAPGVTLTLQPGTVVRFTRYDSNDDQIGEHELFVQGRFLASGTAEQPILFTSAEAAPVSGDWGAINMMASMSENLLQHCRVEYAYRGFHAHFGRARLVDSVFVFNRRGAQFQESDIVLEDCRFLDNLNGLQFRDSTVVINGLLVRGSHWGVRSVNSQVTLADALVEGNLTNGINFRESQIDLDRVTVRGNRRGLYLQRSHGNVDGSVLSDNSEHGLYAEESDVNVSSTQISGNGRSGIRVIDADLVLADDSIVGNALYGLINDGVNDLQLNGNWWGTDDPRKLADLVRDGNDRPGLGLVHIRQPLSAPPACVR